MKTPMCIRPRSAESKKTETGSRINMCTFIKIANSTLTLVAPGLIEVVQYWYQHIKHTTRFENIKHEFLVDITDTPKENEQLLVHLDLFG